MASSIGLPPSSAAMTPEASESPAPVTSETFDIRRLQRHDMAIGKGDQFALAAGDDAALEADVTEQGRPVGGSSGRSPVRAVASASLRKR
jgi:hypothetical protein